MRFKTLDEIARHNVKVHLKYRQCRICDKYFKSMSELSSHQKNVHMNYATSVREFDPLVFNSARFTNMSGLRFDFERTEERSISACLLLRRYKRIKQYTKEMLTQFGYFVLAFVMSITYSKVTDVFETEDTFSDAECFTHIHRTPNIDFSYNDYFHFRALMNMVADHLEQKNEDFTSTGSGTVMRYISRLDVQTIRKFTPPIQRTGGCRNRKTRDNGYGLMMRFWNIREAVPYLCDVSSVTRNTCFFTAIAAGMLLKAHPQLRFDPIRLKRKCAKYIQSNIITKGVKCPFSFNKAHRFEVKNAHLKVRINIFTWSTFRSIIPVYRSHQNKSYHTINVLLLQPVPEFCKVGHYVLITDLSKLVHKINNRPHPGKLVNETYYIRKVHVCELCLWGTNNIEHFKTHTASCKNNRYQIIDYPDAGDVLEYKGTKMERRSPFICFLDFEAKMTRMNNKDNYVMFNCNNCARGGPVRHCTHSERLLTAQLPMTYSIYVFNSGGELVLSKTESCDTHLMEKFFATLDAIDDYIENNANAYKDLHWTDRLEQIYRSEYSCYLCNGEFVPACAKYRKVRDHDHSKAPVFNSHENKLESIYLGAAHALCNLNRQNATSVPVYVHNLMNYDANFIIGYLYKMRGLAEYIDSMTALPYNSTKFKTFTIGRFVFKDSFQLLSGSLSELADDLALSDNEFRLLKQAKLVNTQEQFTLLFKKAVYPYEWVDSVKQLQNTLEFPAHECFYSSLTGKNISLNDYNTGKELYFKLKCKNMLEYTELYCKLDTLLLAEVVFSYREFIWDEFNLAIENYLSTPQIALDACLKSTKKRIGLMHRPEMISLIERNLRGGVSFVNTRHVKLKDTDKETILYCDANNLYGFAQKLLLPEGQFEQMQYRDFIKINWSLQSDDQPIGYIIEADLVFPESCHDLLDELPLAPDHVKVTFDKMSPFSQTIHTNIKGPGAAQRFCQEKLVTSLEPKRRYCLHYLTLQFYLTLGVKLLKVHSVIRFKQSDFLKQYINFISDKRANAKSGFKKRLFKLLANSLYGKFIQDVRKYSQVRFATSEEELHKYASSPYFMNATILKDDVIICNMRNEILKLNKAYAVGFSILELSKLYMYKIWYEIIKPRFRHNVELVLTDTDSFIVHINNFNKAKVYDMLKDIMDFSNLDPNNPFYSKCKEKIPGYFKDEFPKANIMEVVGVRSKCYYIDSDQSNHVVCKGISKNTSQQFPLNLYKQCVYSMNTSVRTSSSTIRNTKKRIILTETITKQAFASPDEKRYQLCHIHSVPYGSYRIQEYLRTNKCFKCMK